MSGQMWWYLARATGLVSWSLLSLALVWGLLLRTRVLTNRPTPRWLLDLHRFLGALSVVFIALHLIGLAADSYLHFGVADLLVPLASGWRPVPVALGVVAFYLLVAVEVTSLLMRHMPKRWWRGIHLSSYLAFFLGTLHAATAGTDARNLVLILVMNAAVAAILFLVLVRLLAPSRGRSRAARTPAAGP